MEPAYKNLNIQSSAELLNIESRFICEKCKSSRKFFCYKCSSAHPQFKDGIPNVKLPIKIDIIKHKQEVHGKSTSSHARIVSPDDVTIYEFPDIPDYSSFGDEVVLIFPSSNSVSISSLFNGKKIEFKGLDKGFTPGTMQMKNLSEVIVNDDKTKLEQDEQTEKVHTLDNLPFKRAVFIDSTWKQCRSIYRDPRINPIRSCIIQNRVTKFWRVQKGAPKWYLSTIEAIHQFLLELHISAWGITRKYHNECLDDLQLDSSFIPASKIISNQDDCEPNTVCKPYSGQYDNLLFFFSFLYSLIHSLEEVNGPLNIYRPTD